MTHSHSFLSDLRRNLDDNPEFRRGYIEASLRIQAIDAAVNAGELDASDARRAWRRRFWRRFSRRGSAR